MIRVTWALIRIAIGCALVAFAYYWRAPLFSSVRYPMFVGIVLAAAVLLACDLRALRRGGQGALRFAGVLSLMLAGIALCWTVIGDGYFRWVRYAVLHADGDELAAIGRHIVVGYRNSTEVRSLIERRAIGGVFVTRLNVNGRSAADIAAEISGWQRIRAQQGLAPLWISTDQEGGGVSRMSPPLPRQPALGSVVSETGTESFEAAVRAYAELQAQGLRTLGVNMNFAPVVDINHGVINADDKYSQIYRRAISADPAIVARVATIYCAALRQASVECVPKHFPGLGRVTTDTHVADAMLDTPVDVMAGSDWVPFRAVATSDAAFLMLGHVRLGAVDRDRPASFSPAIVDLLRSTWRYEGALITDDATMSAFYDSPSGFVGGMVEALNAGVDLILIAYDPDQYYMAAWGLIQARRSGALSAAALEASAARLETIARRPR